VAAESRFGVCICLHRKNDRRALQAFVVEAHGAAEITADDEPTRHRDLSVERLRRPTPLRHLLCGVETVLAQQLAARG
jgi:hypothetical protein